MRWLAVLLILVGSAWAQDNPEPCANRPYTLETPQGIVGGGSLEYDGEVAVFADGACVETTSLFLQAPALRYQEAEGVLELENLEARTSNYRFRARKGIVKDNVFRAEEIWLTPCRCGEELRALSSTAEFDLRTGDLLLNETRVDLFRFTIFRTSRLPLDRQALTTPGGLATAFGLGGGGASAGGGGSEGGGLVFPVRFGYDRGLVFGVEDFPFPFNLSDISQGTFNLTLIASGLGGSLFNDLPKQSLAFGLSVSQKERSAGFRFDSVTETDDGGNVRNSLRVRSRVEDGPLFMGNDTGKQLAEGGVRFGLNWEGWAVKPFFRIAQEDLSDADGEDKGAVVTGLSLGSELRYPLVRKEGAFTVRLEPWALGAIYDQQSPYLAYGGTVEGRYEANFSLRLTYNWSSQNSTSRFKYERRGPTNLVSAGLLLPNTSVGSFNLQTSYNFVDVETKASLRYELLVQGGQLWLEARTRIEQGLVWGQGELVAGFIPDRLDCTFAWSFSPTLGYDFVRRGVSRAGLEVRYADCCFIWKVGYQAVLIPQNTDEQVGGRFSLGLELR